MRLTGKKTYIKLTYASFRYYYINLQTSGTRYVLNYSISFKASHLLYLLPMLINGPLIQYNQMVLAISFATDCVRHCLLNTIAVFLELLLKSKCVNKKNVPSRTVTNRLIVMVFRLLTGAAHNDGHNTHHTIHLVICNNRIYESKVFSLIQKL